MTVIKLTDLWSYLKSRNKPVILYGTGNGADKIYARLEKDGVSVSGVFSSNGFKKGKSFAGHTVSDYETLNERFPDMIILVAFGSSRDDVVANIKRLMTRHEVYVPDVPVYGDEVFDAAFAFKHRTELETVYGMLDDEQSRTVFESIIRFKLTGNAQLLFNCESKRDEVFRLLSLNGNERFMDLGAYTGDTVEEFINHTESYEIITAVEPDARNFRKLTENAKKINNIRCVNAAVADGCRRVYLSNQHGRGVSRSDTAVAVSCVTVDMLSQIMPPTFIKMDVEGNELCSLCGAADTLINCKPKMQIACYHRSQDIYEIPLKIKSLVPEYRIYMRHHPCIPAWDTNYIFI